MIEEISDCTGLVLAGGEGSRMHGQDKGRLPWRHGTLVSHAAQRFYTLNLPVIISANRNLERYTEEGLQVVTDHREGYQGPLAALEAGLKEIKTSWLFAIPCDNPALTENLMMQFWKLKPSSARAIYARCGQYRHPICCAIHQSCLLELSAFLDTGQRRVMDWWDHIHASAIDLGEDQEAYFANTNTPEEFARLRQLDGQHP